MILIVGAGPVGIYLTKKLLDMDQKVTLIEAGYLESESNLLTRQNYDFKYPSQMPQGIHRVGGGSNFWHARFGEYLDIDFERDWLGGKFVWPILKKQLQPHYENVARFFGQNVPSDLDFLETFYSKEKSNLGDTLDLRLWRFAKSEIFLDAFNSLQKNPNFSFLGGHKVEKFSEKNNSCILKVVRSDLSIVEIQGDQLIITCGAIAGTGLVISNLENSVKNYAGQYLIEHMEMFIGKVRLNKLQTKHLAGIILTKKNTSNGKTSGVGIRLSSNLQIAKHLLQMHLEFRPYYSFDKVIKSSWLPTKISFFIGKSFYLFIKLYEKLISKFGLQTFGIWMKSEEIPTKNSEILFDINSNKFRYYREIGQESVMKCLETITCLTKEIEQNLNIDFKIRKDLIKRLKKGKFINWHPMNTLRMSTNLDYSIVNQDLKLTDFERTYICNSAVLPTGSNSNPTFTVLALADRLCKTIAKSA